MYCGSDSFYLILSSGVWTGYTGLSYSIREPQSAGEYDGVPYRVRFR